MEHRKYTRLPLDIMVELYLDDGTRLYGETADLSLDGAFVNLTPPSELTTGIGCKLELIIKSEDGWVRVEFKSTIAHVKEEGIGVRFEAANAAHHESFLKLFIEGDHDIDKLLEELSQHPRSEFHFTND
ncbi:PilZ domain-containing protein [Kaarinaea lacus]